jgi:hypothetical protein
MEGAAGIVELTAERKHAVHPRVLGSGLWGVGFGLGPACHRGYTVNKDAAAHRFDALLPLVL